MKLKNIFLKGKMNKDLDERLVPQDEYIHAENVQVVKSTGSDVGAVENLLGNKKITNIDFGPNAECVGGIAEESMSLLIWAVASDKGSYWVEYNHVQETVAIIAEDTRPIGQNVLNLQKGNLITGIDLVVDTDNGNILLLYVEGDNPPRCINVERAKTYGPNNFTEEDICLIKKPPIFPPKVTPVKDDGTEENNLRERYVGFAYRNKYLDGEYSALSPFTPSAFLPKDFDFDYSTASNESMINSYKEVNVAFNTGSKLVTDIEVVYKESGSNNVYLVETFNKKKEGWKDNTEVSTVFANNKITKVLPEGELERLYDNVPLKAKALCMSGNMLTFGNYTENYDLIDKQGERVKVDIELVNTSKDIVEGTATKSVKSNRDYEAGLAYLDGFGRMTTVLTSEGNTTYVPISNSVRQNTLKLKIKHKPPAFAKYYRVFLKQNKDNYNTVVASTFHKQGSFIWIKIGPNDLDKFKEGDYLVVKKDTTGVMDSYVETRVIEVKDQPKNFLEEPDVKGTIQEAGLYYKLKPSGFTLDPDNVDIHTWSAYNSSDENPIKYPSSYYEKPVYQGSAGLDDLTVSGTYSNHTEDTRYRIEIDSTDGAEDTFRWTTDGKNYKSGIKITGLAQTLSNGIAVNFESKTGHNRTDKWVVSAKGKDAIGGLQDDAKAYLPIRTVRGPIYAGARINLHIREFNDENALFPETNFVSPKYYANFEEWFYGEEINKKLDEAGFYGYTFRRGDSSDDGDVFYHDDQTKALKEEGDVYQESILGQSPYQGTIHLIIKSKGSKGGLGSRPKIEGNLSVIQSNATVLFETKDTPVSSDIFYELGATYQIKDGVHLGAGFSDYNGSVLELSLPFHNCYSWGNGFESYRIKDSVHGRALGIDSRPLGTIRDYRQNHRKASLTYSGVYEQSMNYNAINEFNLSRANYKDLDDSKGGIQKLYSRDSNLLVLQEHQVSQTLVNKNVVYNADGSSSIQKTTEVLGETIPYSGEYGISTNPESFMSYGKLITWADAARGKIMKLGGNGLFPISSWGMTSWFRDYFRYNKRPRYIAGYDPYLDKMVLSMRPKGGNGLMTVICNQEIMKYNQTEAFTYMFQLEPNSIEAVLSGYAVGKILVNGSEYIVSGDFTINYATDDDQVTVVVIPTEENYNIKHTCTLPAVAEPEPEPEPTPVEEPVDELYYGYLAIECPSEEVITRYPLVITSPEPLSISKYSEKTVKIGDTGYTFYEISEEDNSEPTFSKSSKHLPYGNSTAVYLSCAELEPKEEETSTSLYAHTLSLSYTADEACTGSLDTTYYMDSSLGGSTEIYSDSAGTKFAPAGFYSDGANVREWTGSSWNGYSSKCTLKL